MSLELVVVHSGSLGEKHSASTPLLKQPGEHKMKKRRSQTAIVRRYMKRHPNATLEEFKRKFPKLDADKYVSEYPSLKTICWMEVW